MITGITNLAHVGISVSDIEVSAAFYRDILGLKLVIGPTGILAAESIDKVVGTSGAKVRVALFRVGNIILELLQ